MKYLNALIFAGALVAISVFGVNSSFAANCPDLKTGDLFKSPQSSAVYYLNGAHERMYFPNAEVFQTWYGGFENVSVTVMDPSCFDNYGSGGGINYRPGSRLVKTTVSPNIFAIGTDNTKHKISDPKIAARLYGPNWEKLVRVIPDVFDSNYRVGEAITEMSIHDGMVFEVPSGDDVIDTFVGTWYKVGGISYKIDPSTLPSFVKADVKVFDKTDFILVVVDANVTADHILANPAQKNTVDAIMTFSGLTSSYTKGDAITGTYHYMNTGDPILGTVASSVLVPRHEFTDASYSGSFGLAEGNEILKDNSDSFYYVTDEAVHGKNVITVTAYSEDLSYYETFGQVVNVVDPDTDEPSMKSSYDLDCDSAYDYESSTWDFVHCREYHIKNCTPAATFSAYSLFTNPTYTIIGVDKGMCTYSLSYPEHINESLAGLEKTCKMPISARVVPEMGLVTDCSGPLQDAEDELFTNFK